MGERKRVVVLAESLAAAHELNVSCLTSLGCEARFVFQAGGTPAPAGASAARERMSRYMELRLPPVLAEQATGEFSAAGLCESVQVVAGPSRPAIARWHAPVLAFEPPTFHAGDRTPDLSAAQTFLGRDGLNIREAWSRTAARGAGVRILDIEWGFNPRHEDLKRRGLEVVFGPRADDDHGTAVLGLLGAHHNRAGVQGICPQAYLELGSGDHDDDGVWNPEVAIEDAMSRLDRGDVIVLEMHTPGPTHAGGDADDGLVPVEYVDAAYDAIRSAVEQGIVVVEAAGNGGMSLDDPRLNGKFDRYVRDSGAILVGAGGSVHGGSPQARLSYSNWGRRVDVQGWGEHVATTGGVSELRYRDLHPRPNHPWPDPNACYTGSFSGTSSATPLVAGCVALANSVFRFRGEVTPYPETVTSALVARGLPQQGPPAEHIGPLPDCAAFMAELGLL